MTSEARQLLSDDHAAVGEILAQLLTSLNDKDVPTVLAKVDLLWARLAVHIRAEHLHLFPAVSTRLTEAESIVDRLRTDHNFFMHELARVVGILRELPESAVDEARWTDIADTVREVEKRLATHNEVEEKTIYPWAGSILTESEQMELTRRINAELENRPPRFSLDAWTDQ